MLLSHKVVVKIKKKTRIILLMLRVALALSVFIAPDIYKMISLSTLFLSSWIEAALAPYDITAMWGRFGVTRLTNILFAVVCTIFVVMYWMFFGAAIVVNR